MEKILLDTNILIEILKGNAETMNQVAALKKPLAISSITAMELFYGARDKHEVEKIARFIQHFDVIYPDEDISKLAMSLVKSYAKSHTLDIPDSLIAATALFMQYQLFTYNLKDFRYLPGLILVAL